MKVKVKEDRCQISFLILSEFKLTSIPPEIKEEKELIDSNSLNN